MRQNKETCHFTALAKRFKLILLVACLARYLSYVLRESRPYVLDEVDAERVLFMHRAASVFTILVQ